MNQWRYVKKILSAVCCLAMALSMVPAAGAAEAGPVKSNNKNDQDYTLWASPVKSHLYENEAGGLTRVEYINETVVIEDYDSSFNYLAGRTIVPELPIWGGFFAGKDYNFLFFGQDNQNEDNSVEVLRAVKYDKNWNRLGQTSVRGVNTTKPFNAGSLRCDEYNGYLYIHTSHEMYKIADGYNHQANMTLVIREQDMALTDSSYEIWNTDHGYISHSFNQFILADQDGTIVTLDHGDALPRSIVFMRYYNKAGQDKFSGSQYGKWCDCIPVQEIPGAIGDNTTGVSVGGLAETADCYIMAYNFDGVGGRNDRHVYYHWMDKASGQSWQAQVTQTPGSPGSTTPVLASTGLSGGYMLWNTKSSYQVSDTLCYLSYDADGQPGALQTATGQLSDCQPVYYNGKVVWYTTDYSAPVFYQLDASGVTATPAGTAAQPNQPQQPANLAYASTQSVLVDGKAVEFQMYALKDEKGNPTNYIKLRDLAQVLNGTAAQFEVGWNGAVNIETGKPYTSNGSEMKTPFSGDRVYTKATAVTNVNGAAADLTALTLKDDNGGAYTYYQLRDLGKALGFNVSWASGKGIFVETDKPYEG